MNLLSSAAPPFDVENARQFELSDELRSLQRQMASLFSHQKRRGGIIDPEAEDSKLLLLTDTVVSDTSRCWFSCYILRKFWFPDQVLNMWKKQKLFSSIYPIFNALMRL